MRYSTAKKVMNVCCGISVCCAAYTVYRVAKTFLTNVKDTSFSDGWEDGYLDGKRAAAEEIYGGNEFHEDDTFLDDFEDGLDEDDLDTEKDKTISQISLEEGVDLMMDSLGIHDEDLTPMDLIKLTACGHNMVRNLVSQVGSTPQKTDDIIDDIINVTGDFVSELNHMRSHTIEGFPFASNTHDQKDSEDKDD